jgi:phage FluMu protein Com
MDIRCPHCGQHLSVDETRAGSRVNCPNCKAEIENPRRTTPSEQNAGIMRHFFREFNRLMTRWYIVIQPRQQPDSPRERLRSQIIIAIFLIAFFIVLALTILGKL